MVFSGFSLIFWHWHGSTREGGVTDLDVFLGFAPLIIGLLLWPVGRFVRTGRLS